MDQILLRSKLLPELNFTPTKFHPEINFTQN